MTKSREIDFTEGPLLRKIILYALPIIGVNLLQLLFTAADVAVLGIFTTDQAVAAVGATTQIVNIMICFFVGLGVGANVLVARAVGARDKERAEKLVGTAIFASIVFGIVIMIVGVILAEQMLIWTKCAESVLPYAKKYLQIYFLGMPIIMLYNFCAAILRAVGDTLRPLIFLSASGVVNILLNVFFIVVVGLDVEGVAIATVVSQLLSAVGALYIMLKNKDGYARLTKRSLKLNLAMLGDIFMIGLPMGLSKCTFSLANVILVSYINELGDLVMAGNAIAKEFDAFILEALHGFSLAGLAVVSQNLGAKKLDRIKKTFGITTGLVSVVGVLMGAILYIIAPYLCRIMTDTPEVLKYAMIRTAVIGAPYVFCGLVNVFQETIRGLGYSNTSLFISIVSNILFRLAWIWCVYPFIRVEGDTAHNYTCVMLVWPISWIVALLFSAVILVYLFKRTKNKIELEIEKEKANVTN